MNNNDYALGWVGNLINVLIFIFLAISIVGTDCFSIGQQSFSAFGIFVSIIIHIFVNLTNNKED